MNDNAKKWVAALRSGNYRQTQGNLHDDAGYCCLGVACEVALKAGLALDVSRSNDCLTGYDGHYCLLPNSVKAWLGLRTCTGSIDAVSLTDRNDTDRWSFSQIADLIESEPPGLFA